jgi:hypothetical protein
MVAHIQIIVDGLVHFLTIYFGLQSFILADRILI